MPKWVIPISRKTSMASLRMGPRQTMSGFMSSQAKERTQAERRLAETAVAVDQRVVL